MKELEREFIERLANKLLTLPGVGTGEERHESWMTAERIAAWWSSEAHGGLSLTPAVLDMALLEHWEHDETFRALKIRPAKYPDAETVCRLWGHEDRVGARPSTELQQRRMGPPQRFEELPLSSEAQLNTVFLSHSLLDQRVALRVRRALADHSFRAWLAEEQIPEGAPIFEAVRVALQESTGQIVLLTRNSLGSAWVYTESVGGQEQKMMVCDADDHELMALMASWHPPTSHNEMNFSESLLDPLEESYRKEWNAKMPPNLEILDGAAGVAAGWKRRPDKYREGAKELLFVMGGVTTLALYPARPSPWKGAAEFLDFTEGVMRLPRGQK
jgi:TIR domain